MWGGQARRKKVASMLCIEKKLLSYKRALKRNKSIAWSVANNLGSHSIFINSVKPGLSLLRSVIFRPFGESISAIIITVGRGGERLVSSKKLNVSCSTLSLKKSSYLSYYSVLLVSGDQQQCEYYNHIRISHKSSIRCLVCIPRARSAKPTNFAANSGAIFAPPKPRCHSLNLDTNSSCFWVTLNILEQI